LTLRLEVLRKWRSGEKVNAEKNSLERIERLAESWRRIFKTAVDNSAVADEEVGRLLAAAYPERIARQTERNSERYKLANGRVVKLPPHDPLMREPWLSVAHLDAGKGEGKIFLAAPLNEEGLHTHAHQQETVRWDAERGMVVGVIEKRIGNVVLETKPLPIIPPEKRIKVLCEAVRAEGLKIIGWSETENQWQARVMSLRTWRPEEGWPDVSESHLLNTLEEWLSPYLLQANKRTDLQRLDVRSILAGLLPWNLTSRLDILAPATLEVPSGSMISLTYGSQGQPPVMEVRLQEVFGLLETPSVNDGKAQVILHLLSPGYKPVQVTRDLKSFWQTTYHEVRKELRIRYRKHSWPEDPWTAKAVRGVKRR
jgi:ATP-dependent helicase HrpB